MSIETVAVRAWLHATLAADPQLRTLVGTRISNAPPLSGTVLPCVRYSLQPGGADQRAIGGGHKLSRAVWEVTVIGKPGPEAGDALQAAADRIDELLGGVSATSGGYAIRVAREAAVDRPDVAIGTTRYAHLGGLYRIYASPA